MLYRALALLVAPFLLNACATASAPSFNGQIADGETSSRGLVSAADPRAAEAGAAMLRQGGSATDAAIATMLALTVVEPQSSGIGGGGFFVHGAADGTVETLDGRETAPDAAMPEWFLNRQGEPRPFDEAVLSGLSVGVPGNIQLAEEAHKRHGKLPWAKLFEPAIALARDGFAMTDHLRTFLIRARDRAAADPDGRQLFYDEAGEPLRAGTVVKNPALAETLAQIAADGADWFYSGENAEGIAMRVAAETPHDEGMTVSDIGAYEAKMREPVCGEYRTYRICGMGPPSSGATTVYAILKQLERFDLGAMGPQSPTFWHVFAESQRLAYADRERYLADTDFVSVPINGLIAGDYLGARGSLIDPAATMQTVRPGTPAGVATVPPAGQEPTENGTSHFVAVDKAGNVVSYTSTIEGSFGSGIVVGGYYLNNELTDFSFVPAVDGRPVANRVEGRKRPRSSMSPTLVYDASGRLVLAVGAAGGATIPVQVARALIGMLDFGLPPREALALPVLFSPGEAITVEQGSALEAMIPQLRELGHAQVSARPLPLKANAALLTATGWIGAADPRSEGAAVTE